MGSDAASKDLKWMSMCQVELPDLDCPWGSHTTGKTLPQVGSLSFLKINTKNNGEERR